MHLRDHKVEALLRVCFIIEDELTLHVVELEQFYSDSVAIRDKDICLTTRLSPALLKICHLHIEILQRINEGF